MICARKSALRGFRSGERLFRNLLTRRSAWAQLLLPAWQLVALAAYGFPRLHLVFLAAYLRGCLVSFTVAEDVLMGIASINEFGAAAVVGMAACSLDRRPLFFQFDPKYLGQISQQHHNQPTAMETLMMVPTTC